MDLLKKKMPILALIFLILVSVYAVKYRSIQGFSTTVPLPTVPLPTAPPTGTPTSPLTRQLPPDVDAEVMKYYTNVIIPPLVAFRDAARPIQYVADAFVNAARPVQNAVDTFKKSVDTYNVNGLPSSVKNIVGVMSATHASMEKPFNTLISIVKSSVPNKAYVIPILHRELVNTMTKTMDAIVKDPTLLSMNSLQRGTIFGNPRLV